jgi:hypothetical protein
MAVAGDITKTVYQKYRKRSGGAGLLSLVERRDFRTIRKLYLCTIALNQGTAQTGFNVSLPRAARKAC